MQPSHIINLSNRLGEGASWRAADQTFWWTDILAQKLYCLDYVSMRVRTFDPPERIGSFGFVTEDEQRLICAFETGFAFYWPDSGRCDWIVRPLADTAAVRLNDGRIDRQGRFWCGAMVENTKKATAADAACLYRLDADLECTEIVRGLHISNALAWSPDGSTMYFADSLPRTLWRFDFDIASGIPSAQQVFRQYDAGETPDGATVDAAGNLWLAVWGGSRVDCISADGRLLHSVAVPTPQPTCVCFGGPQLTTLFVTTAQEHLSAQQLAGEPLAGALLIYEQAGQGMTDTSFRLG